MRRYHRGNQNIYTDSLRFFSSLFHFAKPDVAVSAKELFFLTPGTRVRGALLAQLVQQCEDVNVRLTNIYSPEPKTVLQFTGPGEQVEEAKVLWNKLKKNISNNAIDTHTKVPFKPYQLANLSDASGAYITPGKKDKGSIQLRVATIKKIAARQRPDSLPSASPVNIAARNIRFLAANNELMEKVPKYSYSDEAFGYEGAGVYFPIILAPKDTPWYLRKLPVTALLRYTSQDNASRNKVLLAAGNVTTSMEHMEKQLLTPVEMLVNNSSRGNAVEIEVSTPDDTPSQTCENHPSEQRNPLARELIVK